MLVEASPSSAEIIKKSIDKLLPKLANTWRGTLLTIKNDSQDLVLAGREGMNSEIFNACNALLSGQKIEDIELLMQKAASIVQSFLSSKYIVTNIDSRGLVDLFRLAVQASLGNCSMSDVEVRIGFGAVPMDMPNARLPSYILAAKTILQALKSNNGFEQRPKVVLYSASRFVQSVNKRDGDNILSVARNNFLFIKRYLDQFAQDEAPQFTFDEDVLVEPAGALDELIGYYAEALKNAADFPIEKARDKVIEMGSRYGSRPPDSLRYAAAHALYAGDDVPGPSEPILANSASKPRHLVMIGGEPEKTFWRIRQGVIQGVNIKSGITYFRRRMEALSLPSESTLSQLTTRFEQYDRDPNCSRIQLISQAGQFPVYGKYDGDFSIKDVTNIQFGQMLARKSELRMKRDLLAVLCDIARVPADVAYTFTDKTVFGEEIMTKLTHAYVEYSEFCSNFLRENPTT